MSVLIAKNSMFHVGNYDINYSNIFEDIEKIYKRNEFTYLFFKEAAQDIPQFIFLLNYHYKTKSEILNSQFEKELERKIVLYSIFLLREIIDDINTNYKLIKQIYYIVGSQIIQKSLEYMQKRNITCFQFSNYHLYDFPSTAISHIILNAKPLKDEQNESLISNLKKIDLKYLLVFALFSFKWRKIFEEVLNIEGFADFLEYLYSLNQFRINNNSQDPLLNKGNILIVDNKSPQEGLIDYKKFNEIIKKINIKKINLLLSIVENQKFEEYDIIILFKLSLIKSIQDNNLKNHYRKDLEILSLGSLGYKENLKERYLDINSYCNDLDSITFLEDFEVNKLAAKKSLKNMASIHFGGDDLKMILVIENEIAYEREKAILSDYNYNNYRFQLEKNNFGKPKIALYKDDRLIDTNHKVAHLNEYQLLEDICDQYNNQERRLAKLFEQYMIDEVYFDQDDMELLLENDVIKQILTKTLIINDQVKIGFYDIGKSKLFCPLDSTYYKLGCNFKIIHPIDLLKMNQLDNFKKLYIENKWVEYFPQIFRSYYKKELIFNKKTYLFNNYIINKESFIYELSKLEWFCNNADYFYKYINNYKVVVRIAYMSVINSSQDIEIEKLYCTIEKNKMIDLNELSDIHLSEIIRDIEIAYYKSINSCESSLLPIEKLEYINRSFQDNLMLDIRFDERNLYIKKNNKQFQIDLCNENCYFIDDYNELHLIEGSINHLDVPFPNNPMNVLTEKILSLEYNMEPPKKRFLLF